MYEKKAQRTNFQSISSSGTLFLKYQKSGATDRALACGGYPSGWGPPLREVSVAFKPPSGVGGAGVWGTLSNKRFFACFLF